MVPGMAFGAPIFGNDLPPSTVCLTFDDGPGLTAGPGPGPRTLELGQFLYERGIPAAFFVVGQFAARHRDVVQQIADMGHLLANHTFTHPRLSTTPPDRVTPEILDTDHVIADMLRGRPKLFRPPYGDWDGRLARLLNRTPVRDYLGPVLWDIDARDWECWRNGVSAACCAAAYLRQIRHRGRGIILLHDGSVDEDVVRNHNTLEVVQRLVDGLHEDGYRFVALDSLPQVQRAGSAP